MKLMVMDRMMLMQVLPQEGNLAELLINRKLIEKVGITPEEHKQLNIRPGVDENGEPAAGRIQWDAKADTGKEIEFKGPETKMIVTALEQLDKQKKLGPQHVSLCEMFGLGNGEG